MAQFVALLRGINLGRHNRISMADLRELLAEVGFEDVRTHLQSGNVVLSTTSAPAEAGRAIEAAISGRLGLSIDVIIRTGQELADVVAANPLGDVATDPSKHFVVFLSREPDSAVMRELATEDFSPDQFSARGRELYVWCPDGMRDSRLMKVLTRKRSADISTVRNWNTVTKLLEMVAAVLCVAVLAAGAPATADARRPPGVRLNRPVERVELCGMTRAAVVAQVGSVVRARLVATRGRVVRVDRCAGSRWVAVGSRRVSRGPRGVVLDTSRDGDYRIRAVRARGARAAYLRVGVGEIVDVPVRFGVRNVNRSAMACPADGAAYELAGSLVAPKAALSGPDRPAATVYLHGVEVTGGYWRLPVPGYDLAYEMARRGHVSVLVDRLGFGASGRPPGSKLCVGSQADVAHQAVEQLRAGSYRVVGGGGAVPRFDHVVVAGHSGGAIVSQVLAYSFTGVDAFVIMGYHDQAPGPALVAAGLQGEVPRCPVGGVPADGDSGPPGYTFIWPTTDGWSRDTTFDAAPEVRAALRPLRRRTACGEIESALTAAPIDAMHLGSVRVPVLLLYGREDVLFPYQGTAAQAMAYSGSRDVTLVGFARAGHQFFHDRVAPQVHETLSRWLRAHAA